LARRLDLTAPCRSRRL